MAATSPRLVPGGFFRVHLYVLLGLSALAAIASWGQAPTAGADAALWPALAALAVSYAGAILWLYEKPRAGRLALIVVAACAAIGAWGPGAARAILPPTASQTAAGRMLSLADPVSGGLVLGTTMAAMLLGHWYLNTPSMKLSPLRRLVAFMAIAVVLRGVVCGIGLVSHQVAAAGPLSATQLSFVALRWLAGVAAPLLLAWMTWRTLKIPNTQSATGILYVGVITTFLGELTSLLMSRESAFPL